MQFSVKKFIKHKTVKYLQLKNHMGDDVTVLLEVLNTAYFELGYSNGSRQRVSTPKILLADRMTFYSAGCLKQSRAKLLIGNVNTSMSFFPFILSGLWIYMLSTQRNALIRHRGSTVRCIHLTGTVRFLGKHLS